MTRTRRVLTLIGLAVAITIAGTLPASATFSETVAVPTGVSTGTVAAPAAVTVNDRCQTVATTTVDPLTGDSVMTLTSYVWTAESAKTPVLAC